MLSHVPLQFDSHPVPQEEHESSFEDPKHPVEHEEWHESLHPVPHPPVAEPTQLDSQLDPQDDCAVPIHELLQPFDGSSSLPHDVNDSNDDGIATPTSIGKAL